MKRGLFISFEGVEGSGKSTHAARVAARLRGAGVDVAEVREPGGTDLGERLRQVLQHTKMECPVSPPGEMFLFCACRAQLVQEVIRPALQAGRWVLCDRFSDSTTAYQGYGRGVDLAALEQINALATGGLVPDLTVLLDVDEGEGIRRAASRGGAVYDRFEAEKAEFHAKVRNGYRAIAAGAGDRVKLVASGRPEAEVSLDVWRAVEKLLGKWLGGEGR
ncbi:MAG: dTMP kinase [Lentisphaerae bacterium]|nr:dTMP kinase [Lentisphaerota bacterium]